MVDTDYPAAPCPRKIWGTQDGSWGWRSLTAARVMIHGTIEILLATPPPDINYNVAWSAKNRPEWYSMPPRTQILDNLKDESLSLCRWTPVVRVWQLYSWGHLDRPTAWNPSRLARLKHIAGLALSLDTHAILSFHLSEPPETSN